MNLDRFSLDLMQRIWAIGNRHGPDSERKAAIQEEIRETVQNIFNTDMVIIKTEHNADLFCDYFKVLSSYIKEKDMTKEDVPVGFRFNTDGKFTVLFSLSSPLIFPTVKEGMQYTISLMNEKG